MVEYSYMNVLMNNKDQKKDFLLNVGEMNLRNWTFRLIKNIYLKISDLFITETFFTLEKHCFDEQRQRSV